MSKNLQRLIVVTGLSGGGKTSALHALEDLGFFCIDNLPIALLLNFAQHVQEDPQSRYERVAVGIDARNPAESLASFPDTLSKLKKSGVTTELIFMESDDSVLIKRYSETRRKHPLSTSDLSLAAAIKRERKLLEPMLVAADMRLDTTHTYIHQLRELVWERIGRRSKSGLSLQFMSFGYKYGVPPDADFVFDVRCLPNPYWEAHLRQLVGSDQPVADYLEAQPKVRELVTQLTGFLDVWIPLFEADNRAYLTVAVGCTGGHHRSVYMVERLGGHFRKQYKDVLITHRDI
jgi:UPF0042 nucleotide-binding protein